MPLLSILMPTLNAAEFIEAALGSIANQGLGAVEVVMSDGGSADGTLARAAAFGERHDLEVRILPGVDTGQSEGLNRALAAARGELIAWLNANDEFAHGSLPPLVQRLVTEPRLSLVYGHHEQIDEAGRTLRWTAALPPRAWILRHESFVMNAQSMVWRRSLHERVGGFDTSLTLTMDYDLMLRFLDALDRSEVRRLDVTVGRFRRHAQQKTQSTEDAEARREHRSIQQKLGRRSGRDHWAHLPYWWAGRTIRLWSELRFGGPRHAIGLLRLGPALLPPRAAPGSGTR
ncbi:MAG: hypothetical protein RLZZ163_1339 [Actinomycetota bacterium]|jgi:glycosyltransferase involved in cell wall biosynthesis